ncbi:MAG TPA: hypothetical protein VK988_12780 [Acidimicrobiales bacterium]|nr:hypothetical protein [Acidimicrobiales bacterium]
MDVLIDAVRSLRAARPDEVDELAGELLLIEGLDAPRTEVPRRCAPRARGDLDSAGNRVGGACQARLGR